LAIFLHFATQHEASAIAGCPSLLRKEAAFVGRRSPNGVAEQQNDLDRSALVVRFFRGVG
jgi:hypothetical protein